MKDDVSFKAGFFAQLNQIKDLENRNKILEIDQEILTKSVSELLERLELQDNLMQSLAQIFDKFCDKDKSLLQKNFENWLKILSKRGKK